MNKKKVAFVCVHNSCRSQIAEAFANKYGSDQLIVYSAGTEENDRINPDAVRLMKQLHNIDLEADQHPKLINEIPEVDYLITMGCNVVCPYVPYTERSEDWGLDDPSGKPDAVFINTIQTIEKKVKELIKEIESA